jgi:hypothetical protein
MAEEILVVKKDRNKEKLHIKITDRHNRGWTPNRYLKIIPNKDFNRLAELFFDLYKMGYNIDKAYLKFKDFLNEPDLFFLA